MPSASVETLSLIRQVDNELKLAVCQLGARIVQYIRQKRLSQWDGTVARDAPTKSLKAALQTLRLRARMRSASSEVGQTL